MSIYLVIDHHYYEKDILGVYNNKEAALDHANTLKKTLHNDNHHHDHIAIQEYVVSSEKRSGELEEELDFTKINDRT